MDRSAAPAVERGVHMAAEVAEQPAVLARLLAEGTAPIADAARLVAERSPRFVLLAARGTSDHAALYAKYLVEVRLGLPAGLVSPSTMTVYGTRPDFRDVLMIAVSQSGGSPDLLGSLTAARECGATTVAVTNAADSELARAADAHIDVLAGTEKAVAATKSYTAELLALLLLVEGIRIDGKDASETARQLPELAQEALSHPDAVAEAAARYRFAQRIVTTARGFSYPTAREAALKLMETSYLSAQPFSGADLLHGPMAMVDETVPVVAVLSHGEGGRAMQPVLERLAHARADVLRVGGPVPAPPDGSPAQHLPVPNVPDHLQPVLDVLPLQQLALRLALDRGSDPDAPRGLSKITRTL